MSTRFFALSLALSSAYASPVFKRDDCADNCLQEYRSCQSDTSNTRAQCASDFSSCLGYLPYDDEGSLVTPTACSQAPAATTTAAGTSECADNCLTEYRECQSDTSNTRAQCASDFSSCLGYLPYDDEGSLVTPTACSQAPAATTTAATQATSTASGTGDCAQQCNDEFDACREDLSNTRAGCVADYAGCLGYNPYLAEEFETPTACSKAPAATTTAAANQATSTASGSTDTTDCAQQCNDEFDACREDLSNTRAGCVADYAGCLGYNPYMASEFETPTACSTSPAATSTGASASSPKPTPATNKVSTDGGLQKTDYTWTLRDFTRDCTDDGCDYSFAIDSNVYQTQCSIHRDGGKADVENFAEQQCQDSDSAYTVSWGYSTQFDTPFATLTVHDYAENQIAYFGIDNPNAKEEFGDVGPSAVYQL